MRASVFIGFMILWATWSGCGTTKWTDTARTATEQLLITDSIDRAVSRLDLAALAGKTVFVDDTPVKQATDCAYLLSALRQHVLASGAILKDKREDADYILEMRAGAIGTDRHDLLYGIPATNLPTMGAAAAVPSQIPEIAFAKKTDQRGVAKISLFAYNKTTGRPVWQSGAVPEQSNTKALWVLGVGPLQRGTIHRGTTFAGSKVRIPLIDPMLADDGKHAAVAVADEAFFVEPPPTKTPVAAAKNASPAGAASNSQAKDQAAATPTAKPPAASPSAGATPAATIPASATPAASPSPGVQPAGATAPNTAGDKKAERIGEVPASPAVAPAQPVAPGDFRPALPRPSPGGVAPASAILPLEPSAAASPSPEGIFRGDTWLDRRR